MLLTVLEIIAFMVAVAILGVLLGWVLRGAMGSEQQEITSLRAQLRTLKKAKREAEAAASKSQAEKVASTNATISTPAADVKKEPAKKQAAVQKVATKTKPKPKAKKVTAKAAPRKGIRTKAKPANNAATSKKIQTKPTKAERAKQQTAAKKEVVSIVSRVGKATSKDDLTKIYGIGPKYAAMLNKMGVSSYAQIAKFRKAEVRTVAAAIGSFSGRVERDDWVAGAKKVIKENK